MTNVKVIDEPTIIGRWALVPYIHNKEKFKQAIDTASGKRDFLLCHQGVKGAMMSEYAIDDSSVDISTFASFKQVFSGHYHRTQRVGENFMYWGSPFTTRFDESEHDKFMWRVKFVEDEGLFRTTALPTNVRRHHQFEFENQIPDKLQPVGPKDLVKVVVRGEKSFVQSITKEKVKELFGVESAVVVPMVMRKANHRLDVNSTMNPQAVVQSFLKSAATTLDKDRLMQYFTKVTT